MLSIQKVKKDMEDQGMHFDLPRFQLGIKKDGGGVEPTGYQVIKFLEEKGEITYADPITNKPIKALGFIVEHEGVKKTYKVKMFSPDGEPYYLLSRLQNVELGKEVGLEMKKNGVKNYIEVTYPIQTKESAQVETVQYADDKSGTQTTPEENPFPPEGAEF